MKALLASGAACALLLGLAAVPAPAQAGGSISFGVHIGGGHYRHHRRHRHPHFYPRSVFIAPRYAAPVLVVPAEPTVYIERPQPLAATPPAGGTAGTWYFCPASSTYYPYVRECPGGWQAVPATPPR